MDLLSVLAALCVATLMGMGVGGGGLLVIFLTLCLNYPQILAQGTNLVFFLFVGVASVLVHLNARRLNVKQILIMSALGSVGSLIFSNLATIVSPEIPKKILGGLLLISGLITLYKSFKLKKK